MSALDLLRTSFILVAMDGTEIDGAERSGRAGVKVLDNPVWHALTGQQRRLGAVSTGAARYLPDVAPFGALGGESTSDWSDLQKIVGPSGEVSLLDAPPTVPPGWRVERRIDGVQMIGTDVEAIVAAGRSQPQSGVELAVEPQPLGPTDVPDMLALVAATQPGPFRLRTIEFGGYFGIRSGGSLVAMAGQRVRPPGYGEISAVATDPEFRGRGLATTLVLAVATSLIDAGEIPFLHTSASNTGAIRLYQSLGFTMHRKVSFTVLVFHGDEGRPVSSNAHT